MRINNKVSTLKESIVLFFKIPNTVSAKLHNGDDSKLKNALAISRRLSSEMESLLGEIQRQLSVNAITLTNNGKRFNYGQTIMAILYIMTYLMGVSM